MVVTKWQGRLLMKWVVRQLMLLSLFSMSRAWCTTSVLSLVKSRYWITGVSAMAARALRTGRSRSVGGIWFACGFVIQGGHFTMAEARTTLRYPSLWMEAIRLWADVGAAVNFKSGSSNEVRMVRGEKYYCLRNIIRIRHAAHRGILDVFFIQFFPTGFVREGCRDS